MSPLGSIDPGNSRPLLYTVIGRAPRARRAAGTDARVEAFHKNLRSEIFLGRGAGD